MIVRGTDRKNGRRTRFFKLSQVAWVRDDIALRGGEIYDEETLVKITYELPKHSTHGAPRKGKHHRLQT